jgi:hypothetical protein
MFVHTNHLNGVRDIISMVDVNGRVPQPGMTQGWTPLMVAARWAVRDIAEFLLANGADINAVNSDGNTALDIALGRDNAEAPYVVRVLRWAGGLSGSDPRLLQARAQYISLYPRKRKTTDWMELCNTLGENGVLDELREIVKMHTKPVNFDRVKKYFGYGGNDLNEFKSHIDGMTKRKICAGLAKYYDDHSYTFEHDCSNDTTISGDDLDKLPPERVIVLCQNHQRFCFDVLEVNSLGGVNPYNRERLPAAFLNEARARAAEVPAEIHTLRQRPLARERATLADRVKSLLSIADQSVPYFPRNRFVRTPLKKLRRLAQELEQYDPNFNIINFNRKITDEPNRGKKLQLAREYILTRLLVHPESLGNVLSSFFT